MPLLQDVAVAWKTLVIVCTPIATLPILFIDGSKEMSCLYGVVIVAVFWVTEALPLPVTSLCPVVIFSMLGVMPAKVLAASFVKDTSIFSVACLSFALCVERWQLHRRVALRGLMLVGASPKWLMVGFMLPTWFLSMWVNNTSATAMMVPIVMAVLQELRQVKHHGEAGRGEHREEYMLNTEFTDSTKNHQPHTHTNAKSGDPDGREFRRLCTALSICTCYSASIGGAASLTGTSTNLIVQGQAEEIFAAYGLDSGVNFLSWLLVALPLSALCLVAAWVWLMLHFFGVKKLFRCGCGGEEVTNATRKIIRKSLHALGPMSFAEKAVVAHFVVLVTSWLSMKLPGGAGWHTFFKHGYVNNSTPGILILVSLFIFPSEWPRTARRDGIKDTNTTPKKIPTLLDWPFVQKNFPWGTFCLIGGGYTLAATCQKSGLSAWIGARLSVLSGVSPWLMLLFLTLAISFLTEITSNAATASILGPVLAELALTLGMNPLYLMVPGALACSMAFMLPVATPPNTIVFATGHVKAMDMVKAGVVLNVLCVLVINLAAGTWVNAYFRLDQLPAAMTRHMTPTPWLNVTLLPGNYTS